MLRRVNNEACLHGKQYRENAAAMDCIYLYCIYNLYNLFSSIILYIIEQTDRAYAKK